MIFSAVQRRLFFVSFAEVLFMREKTFRGIALALTIPFLFTSCGKEKEVPQIAVSSAAVRTARLKPMEFQKSIRVQGNVQAIDRVTLSAKVSGTIDALKAREGHRVKKEDMLFQTDRKNLENQVLLAEENLKVAEETYKTTQEDAVIARTTLNKAQLDFNR